MLDPAVLPEPEPADPTETPTPTPAAPGRVARARAWSEVTIARGVDWTNQARATHRTVDVGFLAADRDKRVAAAVLAGGLAYRIFFWILAMSLLANGALGFIDVDALKQRLEAQGVDPAVAGMMQQATAVVGHPQLVAGGRRGLAGPVDRLPGRQDARARPRRGLGDPATPGPEQAAHVSRLHRWGAGSRRVDGGGPVGARRAPAVRRPRHVGRGRGAVLALAPGLAPASAPGRGLGGPGPGRGC